MVDVDRRQVLKALGASAVAPTAVGEATASGSDLLEVSIFQSQLVHDELGSHPQEVVAEHLRAALEIAGFEPASGSPVVGVADTSAVPDYVPDHVVADRVWGSYRVRTPDETPASVLGKPIDDNFHHWGSKRDANADGDKEKWYPANGEAGWDYYAQFLANATSSAKDSNLIMLGGPGGRAFRDMCSKSVALENGDSPLMDIDSLSLARDASDKSAQKLYHSIHEVFHTMTGPNSGPGGDHKSGYRWVDGTTQYVTPMGRYTLGNNSTNVCGNDVDVPSSANTKIYYGASKCMHSPNGTQGFEINASEPDWESKADERRPSAWFRAGEAPPDDDFPAEVTIDPDEPVVVGPDTPVTFDGSKSSPNLGEGFDAFEWEVDGPDGTATGTGETFTHEFGSVGSYQVTLTVTSGGEQDSYSDTVRVEPPPEPAFTFSPEFPGPGDDVSFDASGSSDPAGGGIGSYEWDFGDGNTATGETVTHSFGSAGIYAVELTVTDAGGQSVTTSEHVVVGDAGCGRAFEHTQKSGSLSAGDKDTYSYDHRTKDACRIVVSMNADVPGTDLDLYVTTDGRTPTENDHDHRSRTPGGEETIDLGESAVSGTSELGILVRAYSGSSSYSLSIDEWGTVPNDPPSAEITVVTGKPKEDKPVEFDASSSTDPDGNIDSYEWEFGDGNSGTGKTVTHTYGNGGTYDVTLTVTDTLGESDTDTVSVDVEGDWWPFW